MRSCTQIDIARAVGVSQRAVAAVVGKGSGNKGVRVSEETRRLILETAERMNYRPHRQAQLLRGVKSGVIGLLKTVGVAEYHQEKAYFAAEAALRHGYSIMTSDYLSLDALERSVDMVMDAKVEGVILVGFNHEIHYEPLLKLKESGIPAVALPGGGLPGFPSVLTDHCKGVYDLVVHLAKQGHRSMAYMTPEVSKHAREEVQWTHKQRSRGFDAGVEEMKIPHAEKIILKGKHLFGSREGYYDLYFPGKLIAEKLLSRKKLPDVVLCSNDDWAIGLMGELYRAGLRVPDDLAVVGFDGVSIGEYSIPRLTTIRQETRILGDRAVELLLRIMEGETLTEDERLVLIPGQLIVRDSCAGPKRRSS